MITKFNDFSGVINIDGEYFKLNFDDSKMPFEVNLYVKNGLYNNLSVIVPDSKTLGHKEFFLNPEIEQNIISALKKENFIQETGKESIAGDKKTISYVVNL